MADAWNGAWWKVPADSWTSRRWKFDDLMWATMRHPALIPQVWVNWLGEASDRKRKMLDDNPSRVDFAAFYCGKRYVIEIDGPSHYAEFDGRSYKVNEVAATRTLRWDRSLRKWGWEPIRIGSTEVRRGIEPGLGRYQVVSALGFESVGDEPDPAALGIPEIVAVEEDDFIAF